MSVENSHEFIEVVSGRFDKSKLSIFSIFRDEIFFCRAYFHHYRQLGIQQFLILDDGSQDGTREFLRAQPDCVLLRSPLSYGQEVSFEFLNKRAVPVRAGVAFKSLVPHLFFSGHYGLYADADEFLMLPSDVGSLQVVLDRLESAGHEAVVGPMVEFFPATLSDPDRQGTVPGNIDDLLRHSPYYEPVQLIHLNSDGSYSRAGHTKSEDLFHRYGVKRSWKRPFLPRPRSPKRKVPILKHGASTYRKGSHEVNVPVSPDVMLPFAHFVFTQNFFGKVERATRWRSHAKGAAKYMYYRDLIDRIKDAGGELIGPNSCKFTCADDLIEAGLMRWT